MKSICVYCGSSAGRQTVYRDAAEALGKALVTRGLGLVYGGARIGIMGVIADTVLKLNGHVLGVIPEALLKEGVGHDSLSEIRVTRSMHERKALMAELADGFIAMPGGVGTLEEIFEIWTWSQLGLHSKPCGLLNAGGYYDSLNAFLDHTVAEEFVKPPHRAMLMVEEDPDALIERFEAYRAPSAPKWDRADSR